MFHHSLKILGSAELPTPPSSLLPLVIWRQGQVSKWNIESNRATGSNGVCWKGMINVESNTYSLELRIRKGYSDYSMILHQTMAQDVSKVSKYVISQKWCKFVLSTQVMVRIRCLSEDVWSTTCQTPAVNSTLVSFRWTSEMQSNAVKRYIWEKATNWTSLIATFYSNKKELQVEPHCHLQSRKNLTLTLIAFSCQELGGLVVLESFWWSFSFFEQWASVIDRELMWIVVFKWPHPVRSAGQLLELVLWFKAFPAVCGALSSTPCHAWSLREVFRLDKVSPWVVAHNSLNKPLNALFNALFNALLNAFHVHVVYNFQMPTNHIRFLWNQI